MDIKELVGLSQEFKSKGIITSFSGIFTQGIIEELSEAIQKHLQSKTDVKGCIRQVISIFIEQAQNIINYTERKVNTDFYGEIANSAILIIGSEGDNYFVSSCNLVEDQDVYCLEKRFKGIEGLDKDELKKYYKKCMMEEKPTESIGAGLGIIDMARKSSKPLEYSFVSAKKDFKYYIFKAIV